MIEFKFTDYFENEVLRKRPYLKREWCIYVVENHIHTESQDCGRIRYWALIKDFDNRYLRVVTLADGVTIHNSFFDRRFKP